MTLIEPNQGDGPNSAALELSEVFLASEGPLGVGKTTLAKLLHQTWQAELVLGHCDQNPFLLLFCAKRQCYAWQAQLQFLIDRFEQWTELWPTSACA